MTIIMFQDQYAENMFHKEKHKKYKKISFYKNGLDHQQNFIHSTRPQPLTFHIYNSRVLFEKIRYNQSLTILSTSTDS